MEILKRINTDETVEYNLKKSTKSYFANQVLSNIFYVALWVAFDIFFIYLMTKDHLSSQFWFMAIPVCGLNLLAIWVFVFNLLKINVENNNVGYVLTDKALYYYRDNKYKELKRIELDKIVVVEKSEYLFDGFYVATLEDNIHVCNIKQEKELFEALVSYVKKD